MKMAGNSKLKIIEIEKWPTKLQKEYFNIIQNLASRNLSLINQYLRIGDYETFFAQIIPLKHEPYPIFKYPFSLEIAWGRPDIEGFPVPKDFSTFDIIINIHIPSAHFFYLNEQGVLISDSPILLEKHYPSIHRWSGMTEDIHHFILEYSHKKEFFLNTIFEILEQTAFVDDILNASRELNFNVSSNLKDDRENPFQLVILCKYCGAHQKYNIFKECAAPQLCNKCHAPSQYGLIPKGWMKGKKFLKGKLDFIMEHSLS